MVRRTLSEAEIVAAGGPRVDIARVAAALRHALDCAWWLVRAHVADRHLLPRAEALEPPPAPWLMGWPSEPDPRPAQDNQRVRQAPRRD